MAKITTDQVWAEIEKQMFAVVGMVTARNEARTTGIVYTARERKLYFATDSDTQKFTNMYRNQSVSLSLPDPMNVVIIEGEAHVAERQTIDVLADYFYHKYEWDFRYDDSANWRLIEVTPFKILVWGDGYEEMEGIRVL